MKDLLKITQNLITSKVRMKILVLFFTNPRSSYHMRQINRILGEQINGVRLELMKLESIGLLKSEISGIKKRYSLNHDFIFFNELRSVALKTQGLGYVFFSRRKEIGDIKFALLTHTYLNREESSPNDPDLIVVSDSPNMQTMQEVITRAEELEKKKIHYKVLNLKEFVIAKRRNDIIIYSAMVLPTGMLIGSKEDFVLYDDKSSKF